MVRRSSLMNLMDWSTTIIGQQQQWFNLFMISCWLIIQVLIIWFQPLWKILYGQIASSSQLLGKIKVMFQTTNQSIYSSWNFPWISGWNPKIWHLAELFHLLPELPFRLPASPEFLRVLLEAVGKFPTAPFGEFNGGKSTVNGLV